MLERALLEAPPLRALRPEVPAALAEVIDRALTTDPAARFAGASELLAALGAGAAAAQNPQEVR